MNELNLPVLENGLIPVYEENSRQVADARELHGFLEVGKDFTTWIKDKIEKYDFIEGDDYFLTLTKIGERQNVTMHNYTLTLDTAKEIAMVENNIRGKQIRKYFIEVEKKAKQPKQVSQAELTAMIAQNQVSIERTANTALEIATKTSTRLNEAINNIPGNWCRVMSAKIDRIVKNMGKNAVRFRGNLYKELESTAKANLTTRQQRLQERMKASGSTHKEREAVTKLEVIERDPMLKEMFEGIVQDHLDWCTFE